MASVDTATLPLNGTWEVGLDRAYRGTAPVPGLATDPREPTPGTLWYRRQVALPPGGWTHATLTLKGARFMPAVCVDGREVSRAAGGMTWTQHLLADAAVRPGAEITLEVALASLHDVPRSDASRIPDADLWRSNVSSCLWDDVTLRLHGPARLARAVPLADFWADRLDLAYRVERLGGDAGPLEVLVEVLNADGSTVASGRAPADDEGRVAVPLGGACQPWSPERPTLYRLRVRLLDGRGHTLDALQHPWGLREFRTEGLGFRLNGEPVRLRAGTVVWHRWLRDPEARELAFDEDWFERHVARRLKALGANTLRFHLGMPPERLLDLCDRLGLLVQAEWSFFHGIAAERESLVAQWRDWFDLLMRHPSVGIIHAWNESAGDEVAKAMGALEEVAAGYPPQVLAHRDVIHVHKYWWSLFENLGLYYDAVEQFPQPIMVDEFGGNYLDGNSDPGGYPTLRGAFLRFLGRGHTREMRLRLHTEANARVAEYWRRLGAAGYSPFCILGSPEDGNHHFLGPLAEGRPKPVWDGLAAAYAPLSVSLEVWDRNYLPGEERTLGVYLLNDTGEEAVLRARACVAPADAPDEALASAEASAVVPPHSCERRDVTLRLPAAEGDWVLRALLVEPEGVAERPVLSEWRVRTLRPRLPAGLAGVRVGVPEGEGELRAFLAGLGLTVAAADDSGADVVVAGRKTWGRLGGDASLREALWAAVTRGAGVALLDVGPRYLGQGYPEDGALGPLDGVRRVAEPRVEETVLFGGLTARFRELPEPESCLHPAEGDDSLWQGLPREATSLWNGLRGGLVLPAADMALEGLRPEAYLATWAERGADADAIRRSAAAGAPYYAFELAGRYAFAAEDTPAAREALQQRVRFLVEDAPALGNAINPEAPIQTHDLAAGYARSAGEAERLTPLASAGMNLARVPVVEVGFTRGRLVLSQALTAGRLAEGYGEPGLYGLRPDPAAQQFVLNVLARVRGAGDA